MASRALSVEELHELVAVLARAIVGVCDEMASLEETPIPMPGELYSKLQQGAAMAAAIKRLPEDVRAKLRTIYSQELARVDVDVDDAAMPLELLYAAQVVEDAEAALRSAALFDTALYRVLGRDARAFEARA